MSKMKWSRSAIAKCFRDMNPYEIIALLLNADYNERTAVKDDEVPDKLSGTFCTSGYR